jgi:UDP-glucose 4-epimerase
MGKPDHPVEHLAARNEVMFAYSDHSKADRVFGTQASTSLADGLRKMAAWAREVGVQSAKPFEAVEVRRNLPPSWQRLLTRR